MQRRDRSARARIGGDLGRLLATHALGLALLLAPAIAGAQDSDGDGLSDADETSVHGTNPALYDTDGDGVHDGDEVNVSGSDPLDPDSDDDGLVDGRERVGPGGFNPAELVSPYPTDVAVDLDGDGDPELLATRQDVVSVENRLDEAPPVFGTPLLDVPWGWRSTEPAEAALIDLDDDGDLDLLRIEGFGTPPPPYAGDPRLPEVVLYENRFDEPAADFADAAFPPVPFDSGWLRAVDFDGDGRRDLLRAGWQNAIVTSPTIDVAIDYGAPGLPWFPSTVTLATLPSPFRTEWEVAATDVDDDGHPDVVWVDDAVAPVRLSWARYRGMTGAADFEPPAVLLESIELGAGWRDGNQIRVVDLDDTPLPEIVVVAYQDAPPYQLRIDVHANPLEARPPGAAPLPQTVYFPYSADPSGDRVALVDVDGDGDPDLVGLHCSSDAFYSCYASPLNSIAWVENRLDEPTRSLGPRHAGPVGNGLWYGGPVSHHVADLDLDGDADVLVHADGSGGTLYFENGWNLGTSPLDPDSDGDGLLDGDEADVLSTSPSRADTDGDGVTDRTELDVFGSDPRLVDTDGDGLLDGQETTSPPTTLGLPVEVHADGGTGRLYADVSLVDLDWDGDPDVAVRGLEYVPLENALESGVSELRPFEVESTWSVPADRSDFAVDADGRAIALVTCNTGSLEWHPMDGDPAFPHPSPIAVGGCEQPRFTFVRDLDGDGDHDVLFTDLLAWGTWWAENRLDEPSADFAITPVTTIPRPMFAAWPADLDGDGDHDLLYERTDEPHTQKLIGWIENRLDEPSADFGPEQLIASGPLPGTHGVVTAGDLDGDGDLDPVVTHLTEGQAIWLENRLDEALPFDPHTLGAIGADAATWVESGDLDGDGRDDVAIALAGTLDDLDFVFFTSTAAVGVFARSVIDDLDGNPAGGEVAIADLDGDGDGDVVLNDYEALHVLRGVTNLGTDVLDPDSDDDGFTDGTEVELGSDPNDADSVPVFVPLAPHVVLPGLALALVWATRRILSRSTRGEPGERGANPPARA